MCAGRQAAVALSRPVRSDTTGKALTIRGGGETQWGISNFKGFCGAASHCKKRWKHKQATICKHWGTALVNNKGCTSDLIWNELFLGVSFSIMWLWTCPLVTSLILQWFCHKNRPLWLMSLKNPVVKKTVAGLSGVLPYSHNLTDGLLLDWSLLFTPHQLGDLQTTRQFGLSVCVSTVACNNWYEALSCSHHVSDNPRCVCISRSVRFSNISHCSEVQYFHHCCPDTTVWNANVLLPWNTSGV